MQTAKPFTNVTFTNRVDAGGGGHKPLRRPAEPAYCPGCGAVYVRQRWSHLASARIQAQRSGKPLAVRVCARCRRSDSAAPHGFLHVDGEFFTAHRAELEQRLRDEACLAQVEHPLDQMLTWEEFEGDGLIVATSTDRLAQRLGRALRDAYKGELHFGFSHENRFAHVWWRR